LDKLVTQVLKSLQKDEVAARLDRLFKALKEKSAKPKPVLIEEVMKMFKPPNEKLAA
jgi:hypothetical protein